MGNLVGPQTNHRQVEKSALNNYTSTIWMPF